MAVPAAQRPVLWTALVSPSARHPAVDPPLPAYTLLAAVTVPPAVIFDVVPSDTSEPGSVALSIVVGVTATPGSKNPVPESKNRVLPAAGSEPITAA